MAIINNNLYMSSHGFSKSGVYLTFGKQRLILTKKTDDTFKLNGVCCVFYDQTTYINGKMCIDEFSITVNISKSELSENLYSKLYCELKKTYTNTIDV